MKGTSLPHHLFRCAKLEPFSLTLQTTAKKSAQDYSIENTSEELSPVKKHSTNSLDLDCQSRLQQDVKYGSAVKEPSPLKENYFCRLTQSVLPALTKITEDKKDDSKQLQKLSRSRSADYETTSKL